MFSRIFNESHQSCWPHHPDEREQLLDGLEGAWSTHRFTHPLVVYFQGGKILEQTAKQLEDLGIWGNLGNVGLGNLANLMLNASLNDNGDYDQCPYRSSNLALASLEPRSNPHNQVLWVKHAQTIEIILRHINWPCYVYLLFFFPMALWCCL